MQNAGAQDLDAHRVQVIHSSAQACSSDVRDVVEPATDVIEDSDRLTGLVA